MPDPPPSYRLSRWVFLRLLGLTYSIAFVSLATQVTGLIGPDGILPVGEYLDRLRDTYGSGAYRLYPTLLWLSSSDLALTTLCGFGVAASVLLISGVAPTLMLVLLWGCYLSVTVGGQAFMAFQWDTLLLETGLLACLYAPQGLGPTLVTESAPSPMARWLIWGLLFRLMFLSGITKLASGDPTWSDLTALTYHYETQPLPLWTGWHLHQLPVWFHRVSALSVFAVELILPWLIFVPARFRQTRMAACGGLVCLQLLVGLTGNYGFFSVLSIALCLTLIDDRTWARVLPSQLVHRAFASGNANMPPDRWRRALLTAAAVGLLVLGGLQFVREIATDLSRSGRPIVDLTWSDTIVDTVRPFRSVNGYGLFRVMTLERPEIVVEGSLDGVEWTEWELRWKPGSPERPPRLAAPHQPRLDWQLWFAALDPRGDRYWLSALLVRLLEGEPSVTALMDDTPFPTTPPRFLRLAYYNYRFTTTTERTKTGTWWHREFVDYLTEPVSLADVR